MKYITIVSGLPRSGTSMMMRVLRNGGMPILTDNIRRADADNPHGYFELEAVKNLKQDASWLNQAYGKAVKMVYRLLYDLPAEHNYKIIFMKRKLEQVIASQDVMLNHLCVKNDATDRRRLAELFEAELQKIAFWIKAQQNIQNIYFNYADVVVDPKNAATNLANFLCVELDTVAMADAIDPTLYRQRD